MSRRPAALVFFCFLAATLGPALAPAASAGGANVSDPPNLNGVWEDEKFTQFLIHQDAGSNALSSTLFNDTCKGGPRSSYVEATFNGKGLNGTLTRCVGPDDVLVKNCNLSMIYDEPFSANFTGGRIEGNFTAEWWVWNTTANGTWVNCTLDHYFEESFSWDRLDCTVRSFGELGEKYVSDPAKRDDAVTLAQAFEDAKGGQKLVWTDAQSAPGGLKEKMEAFVRIMAKWGYTGTINSAYRSLLYQAHFADLYTCALKMYKTLKDRPELGEAFRPSVDAIDAEIDAHGLGQATKTVHAGGLAIRLVFICYREPISGCPHVNERAADISFEPNNSKLDWVASLYGMCRPYLFAKTPDVPHWEFFGPNPFLADNRCFINSIPGEVHLSISGNSPINLLATAPDGRRIGYDAANHTEVNDFGEAAVYSGAGTEPQQIDVEAGEADAGDYAVTGVGTGAGPYTVSASVFGGDGVEIAASNVTGTAAAGAPTTALHFAVPQTFAGPNPFAKANRTSAAGSSSTYSVPRGGATGSVTLSGGTFTGLLYDEGSGVLAIGDDGAGGPTQVTIAAGLLEGPYTVRVDGEVVDATVSDAVGGGKTVSFTRPAGGAIITIEGATPATLPTGGGAGPAGGDSTWLIVGLLIAVAAAGIAVVVLRGRKGPGQGMPAAPPPESAAASPPPAAPPSPPRPPPR